MDLLVELREERGKHAALYEAGRARVGRGCTEDGCGVMGKFPCPTARFLDVAIAAAELHQEGTPGLSTNGHCNECPDQRWPCATIEEMTAAWERAR